MKLRFFLTMVAGLLALAAQAAGAAQLSFAHYAPGAGELRLQVDQEVPIALAYGDFVGVRDYAGGTRQIRVTRSDGTALVSGELALAPTDRYVVIVAGNGSDIAPYQLRTAVDHNWPLLARQSSLQTASLAIVANPGQTGSRPLLTGTVCEGTNRSTGSENFGNGTRPLDNPQGGAGFSIQEDRPECVHYAMLSPTSDASAEVMIAAQEGDRLRRFLIGDGVNEPHQMVLVHQGREPIRPALAPDVTIEGLWSVVGEANTGLQVSFNPLTGSGRELQVGRGINAVFFGYDEEGRSTWRTLVSDGPLRVVEYLGGNPDGTRAAVGFERGTALLTVHSCMEMTLTVLSAPSLESTPFPASPRNAIPLKRLFPPTCPVPAEAAPEAQP